MVLTFTVRYIPRQNPTPSASSSPQGGLSTSGSPLPVVKQLVSGAARGAWLLGPSSLKLKEWEQTIRETNPRFVSVCFLTSACSHLSPETGNLCSGPCTDNVLSKPQGNPVQAGVRAPFEG